MAEAVVHRIDIDAAQDDVWRLISTPGHLTECHPFCAANSVRAWPGVGSADTIEYHGGRVVDRNFVAWLEGTGYDLVVTDPGGEVAAVTWRLADRPGGSVLEIGITPRLLGGLPAPLRRTVGRAYVRPMLRRYLLATLRGIKWRAETGLAVERNQFGSHRWFSPRA